MSNIFATSSPAKPASAATSPSSRGILRRYRWLFLPVLGLVAMALMLMNFHTETDKIPLSPYNSSYSGTMALSEILRAHGVRVATADYHDLSPEAAEGTLIVVFDTNALTDGGLKQLFNSGLDTAFLGTWNQKGRFRPYVLASSEPVAISSLPTCSLPWARAAQNLSPMVSSVQPLQAEAVGCFPAASGENYGYVRVKGEGGQFLHFIADPSILTNGKIGQEGNAAFALGLMSRYERVLFVNGDTFYAGITADSRMVEETPQVGAAILALLLLAVVVYGLAAGRRLGPVVSENLPVVVRSSETIHGRGRLYLRGRAYPQVVKALRRAAARRIGQRLGLVRGAGREIFIMRLSEATAIPRSQIEQAFYGPVEDTAADLERLVKALDNIEKNLER